jgi:hypothetical protein
MSHRPCHSRSWAGGHGLKASWRTWSRAMEVLKVAEASNRRDALIGGLFVWQPGRQGCHGGRPPSATREVHSSSATTDSPDGLVTSRFLAAQLGPSLRKHTSAVALCRCDPKCRPWARSLSLSLSLSPSPSSRDRPASRSQARNPFRQAISRLGGAAQRPGSPFSTA